MAVVGDGERFEVLRRRVDRLAHLSLHRDGIDAEGRPAGVGEHVNGAIVGRKARLPEAGRLVGEQVAAAGGEIDRRQRLALPALHQRKQRSSVRRRRPQREKAREQLVERQGPGWRLDPGSGRRRRDFDRLPRLQRQRAQGNRALVHHRVEKAFAIARRTAQVLVARRWIDLDRGRSRLVEKHDAAPPAAVDERDHPTRFRRKIADGHYAARLVGELAGVPTVARHGGGLSRAEQRGQERDPARVGRRRGRPCGVGGDEVAQLLRQPLGGCQQHDRQQEH